MNPKIIVEELPADPDIARVLELSGRNLRWFDEHAVECEIFSRYRGRFIAVSKGELFVGDSRTEVEHLSRKRHPEDIPHIRYIPQEKAPRIYAY
jgi:hypothetical protein